LPPEEHQDFLLFISNGLQKPNCGSIILGDFLTKRKWFWINVLLQRIHFKCNADVQHIKEMSFSILVTATLARGVTKDLVIDRELTFILQV